MISPLATPLCVLTQNKPQRSDLVQPAGLTLVRDSVSSASRVQIEYPHLRLSPLGHLRLVMLAINRANKSGDELLEQEITILIGKLAD